MSDAPQHLAPMSQENTSAPRASIMGSMVPWAFGVIKDHMGTQDLAAVIGSHPQPFQRAGDIGLNGFEQVVGKDIQQMAYAQIGIQ